MARRIIGAIDGERTIAEVLLHAKASEFAVLKLLLELNRKALVTIVAERPADPEKPTLLDRRGAAPRAWGRAELAPADAGLSAAVPGPDDPAHAFLGPAEDWPENLRDEIQVATRLLERGEHEAALELLNATYRAQPNEDHLRRLLARAEEIYVESARRRALSFHKTPVLLPAAREVSREELRPEDAFLLSVIDGESDIQGLLWITPLREVDVLMSLGRLVDRGLVRLHEP
jgi:hypothetical protein